MTGLLNPLLRPVLGPLLGKINGSGGSSRVELSKPSGFDYTPPVKIYKTGSSYSTNFNASDWKVVATADVWVSPSGSDSTGNGSQSLPYRSIKKGLQASALLPDASINLYIKAGAYNRQNSWIGTTCNKDLNIIAVGGSVISSTRFETLSWVLDVPGVYTVSRSLVAGIWDGKYPDVNGIPQKLSLQPSQSSCETTPGSWYTDGAVVFVHLSDGRAPDSSVLVMSGIANAVFSSDNKWYFENIEFEGGVDSCIKAGLAINSNARIVLNNCKARFSTLGTFSDGNGFGYMGIPLVIHNNCAAYANDADGFNYHASSGGQQTYGMEINCLSLINGIQDGANNDNASTTHESCRVVRVNGVYQKTIGPVVADVAEAMSWNLGSSASNSEAGSEDSQDASWQVTGTASSWLDGCSGSGSYYATYATSGAAIYTRNCSLSGNSSGPVSPY